MEKLFCYKCQIEQEIKYFSPQERIRDKKVICWECEKKVMSEEEYQEVIKNRSKYDNEKENIICLSRR